MYNESVGDTIHKTDTTDLESLLEKLRKEIAEKENYLKQVACSSDDLERHADPSDQASKQNLHTTNGALAKVYVERLHDLNEALVRFMDGNFGICEKCDDSIDLKRLEAMPATTLCIDCAREEDQQRTKN